MKRYSLCLLKLWGKEDNFELPDDAVIVGMTGDEDSGNWLQYLMPVEDPSEAKTELSSKVIRVSLGDYALLATVSRDAGITMAEALHLVLERREEVTKASPVG